MAEVLAVMAIISVLAAVATPGFVNMLRDRRTARETGMFTDAFRVARAKAMGRGAAVRVDVTPGTAPFMVLYEHVTGTLDGNQVSADSVPVPGCNADGVWRALDSYVGRKGATTLTTKDAALNDIATTHSVCYTPRGRTMFDPNVAGGGGFVTLQGVVTLTTTRGVDEGETDNNSREILVMPNGLTRMAQ